MSQRLGTIDRELTAIERNTIDEQGVATALSAFGPVWEELFQAEKERIVRLVIERVDCDGTGETPSLTVRDSGIRVLVGEMATSSHEDP